MISNIKILFPSLILLGIYTNGVIAQQSAQVSIPFLLYDNAGGTKNLFFGLDQTASDSLDPQLGESDLPPLPPVGAFDARFILPNNNFNGSLSSWSDYRYAPSFPYSGIKEHRLRYQSAEGATAFYFSWDFPTEVTGLLQDLITGTLVNVQLNGSGVYELTDFIAINQLKLMITYDNIVTVIENNQKLPLDFNLEQNFPNPFNPSTIIKYTVPIQSFINLSIYNLLGENVVTLVNETLDAGEYSKVFNGKEIQSGIYFATLRSKYFSKSIKMLLIK